MNLSTANKAHAGGLAGALTVLAMYLLELVPGVSTMPDGPATALQFVVSAAVGWVVVWLAPANSAPPPAQQSGFVSDVHGTHPKVD